MCNFICCSATSSDNSVTNGILHAAIPNDSFLLVFIRKWNQHTKPIFLNLRWILIKGKVNNWEKNCPHWSVMSTQLTLVNIGGCEAHRQKNLVLRVELPQTRCENLINCHILLTPVKRIFDNNHSWACCPKYGAMNQIKQGWVAHLINRMRRM